MEFVSTFIVLLGASILLAYFYFTRNFDYWKKRNVKYIKPIPFFGNCLPVFLMKKTIGVWLEDLYNQMDGDYFGAFLFDRPVLILRTSKIIKEIILKESVNFFPDRAVVTNLDDKVMNNLLFFKKSPSWKTARAKVSPVFTSGKLKLMMPLILNESYEMTNYISENAHLPTLEAKDIAAKYSTNVIARCAFAVNAQSFRDENAEFRGITKEMFGFRMDTAFRQFGSWFLPGIISSLGIQFFHSKIINRMKTIFRDVVKARSNSTLKVNDLVDILVENNRKYGADYFSEDAMVGHAIQFLAAGFETVSSVLSFILYEMAMHPEIQEKLRKEIQEHTEKDGLTYANIKEMQYLDKVVCEGLRKYPALPFIDRICAADYKLEGSDLVIEKGMAVFIPLFGLHFNPEYFPEPHKFDPERFADKSKINSDGLSYVPFGEGPRICIGERFGLMGVKIGLADILLKFRVEKTSQTPTTIEYEPKSLLLQSVIGVPLKFAPL